MRYRYLDLLTAVFVTTLLVSNIIASKIGAFGPWFMPVGVIIFPISYVLGDVLTEVYGYAVMRRVIWTGFLCNLLAVIAYTVSRAIPAAPFYEAQASFDLIFGSTPRLLIASFVAYLIGSFMNAYVLARMKVSTNGKFLWMRTIGSTIVGEGLDSFVFIAIAFYGIFTPEQIGMIALTQWIFKSAFEAVMTPFTYIVVGALKKAENVDHYDRGTNFQPFSL